MDVDLLPVNMIRRPRVMLRQVDQRNDNFQNLIASVRRDGILNPILVRPNPTRSARPWEVVDGAHRLEAAKAAGLEKIPCLIRDLSDSEALLLQLKANAVTVPTRDDDYAIRLIELTEGLDMSIEELANLVNRTPHWVRSVLRLKHLDPAVKRILAKEKVSVTKRAALATLPKARQKDFVEDAVKAPVGEFTEKIKANRRNFHTYLADKRTEFYTEQRLDVCMPFLRSFKQVATELETMAYAPRVLRKEAAMTPRDGWESAIRWVLSLDAVSQAEHLKRRGRVPRHRISSTERFELLRKVRNKLAPENYDDERTDSF